MSQPSTTRRAPRPVAQPLGSALLALGLCALALALRPSALTLPRSYASDSGVFYAVFDQLARGARLYADVFDHKDPLFYAFYTLCYALLGDVGPMVWETTLTLGALALAVLVGRLAGLGLFSQAIVALGFFAFFLHPFSYFPIHSNHQALTLLLAALALGLWRRDLLAGAVLGALVLTKLTHALYVPAVVLCIIALDQGPLGRATLGRLARMGAAAAATLAAGWLILLLTGSLGGYLDVIGINLRYQAEYARIRDLYWPSTPSGPAEVLRESTSPALLGLFAALLLTGALHALWPARLPQGRRHRALLLVGAALASAAATAAILASSYAWPHYYEVLCVPVLFAALCGLALNERWLSRGWLGLPALAVVAGLALWSGALSPEPTYLGWRDGQSESDAYEDYLRPCIAGQMRAAGASTYATLGGNRAVQVPRLTPPSARLACRAFYQFPWFRGTIIDELGTCIGSRQPDLLFARGQDFPIDGAARLAQLIGDGYRREASCGDVTVLVRR